MLWKPSNIQVKNVKQKTCASYFDAKQCLESPVVKQAGLQRLICKHCSGQVWRLRMYVTERILGAAKPLLYLREKLCLGQDQFKRIL